MPGEVYDRLEEGERAQGKREEEGREQTYADVCRNGCAEAQRAYGVTYRCTVCGRLDALQEQLGHRDINTTHIYLHLSDEDVKREVGKLLF